MISESGINSMIMVLNLPNLLLLLCLSQFLLFLPQFNLMRLGSILVEKRQLALVHYMASLFGNWDSFFNNTNFIVTHLSSFS